MENFELSKQVLQCAFKIYTVLGPGLLESAYQACMIYELRKCSLSIEVEKPLPLVYEEVKLDCGYRMDIVVLNSLILEIKSVEALAPIHTAQMITYLKLTGLRSGLLLNFNVVSLKNGIKRISF
ncbi:MAG: GxxExxY protein [Saprospiraceae bacterium]